MPAAAMALPPELFADLDDVLGKDHLFAADARGVARRGEVARKHPDPVCGVRDDLGKAPSGRGIFVAGSNLPEFDRLALSAASARAGRRQLISSSQLSASMNSAQRR